MATEDLQELFALLDLEPAGAYVDTQWRADVGPLAPAVIEKETVVVGQDYVPAARRALQLDEFELDDGASPAPAAAAGAAYKAPDRVDLPWAVATALAKSGRHAAPAGEAPPPLDVIALQAQLERYMRGGNLSVRGKPALYDAARDYTRALDAADAPPTTCVLYTPEDGGESAGDTGMLGAGMRLHQLGAWQLLRAMAAAQRSDFAALARQWMQVQVEGTGTAYAGWEDDMAAFRARKDPVAFDGGRTPKGALIFHSTGTGKTAVSVAAMQAFWQQYDRPLLYVSTTATVQSVIGKRAAQGGGEDEAANPCGGQATKSEYAKLAELLFPTTLGSNKAAYDAALNANVAFGAGSAQQKAGQCVQSYLGNPVNVSSRLKAVTFKQAAEFAARTRNGDVTNDMCDTKTRIGGKDVGKPKFGGSGNERGVSNAIMIIDEAHNLLSHLEWNADGGDEATRAKHEAELKNLTSAAKSDASAADALGAYQLREFLQSADADGVTLILLTATPGSTAAQMETLCNLMRRTDQDAATFVPLVSYYNGDDNTADFPTLSVPPPVAVPMHPAQAREVQAAASPCEQLKASTIPDCARRLLTETALAGGDGGNDGGLRGGGGAKTEDGELSKDMAEKLMDAVIMQLPTALQEPAKAAKAAAVAAKSWAKKYDAFMREYRGARAESAADDAGADADAGDAGADAAAVAAAAAAVAAGAAAAAAASASAGDGEATREDDISADAQQYDRDAAALQLRFMEGTAGMKTLDPKTHVQAEHELGVARARGGVSPCAVPARMTPEQRAEALMQRAPKLARIASDMGEAGAGKVFAYTQFDAAAEALCAMLKHMGWSMVTEAQIRDLNAFLMHDVHVAVDEDAISELERAITSETSTFAAISGAFTALRKLTMKMDGDGADAPRGVLDELLAMADGVRPESIASLMRQLVTGEDSIISRFNDADAECAAAGTRAAQEACIGRVGALGAELLAVYASAANMLSVLRKSADHDLRAEVNRRLGDAAGASRGKRFVMLPHPAQAEALKVFNHFLNRDGDIIMGIVAVGNTLEGTNLKTARRVIAIEPQESAAKVRQLMGRARRYCSHAELPLAARSVEFVRYASVISDADVADAAAAQAAYRAQDEALVAERDASLGRMESEYRAQMKAQDAAVKAARDARFVAEAELRAAYDAVAAAGAKYREAKSAGGALHARTALLLGALRRARLQYKVVLRAARVAVDDDIAARAALVELQRALLGAGDGGVHAKLAALERRQAALDTMADEFFWRFGFAITSEATFAVAEGRVYAARQAEEQALNAAYAGLARVAADGPLLRNVHARMAARE